LVEVGSAIWRGMSRAPLQGFVNLGPLTQRDALGW